MKISLSQAVDIRGAISKRIQELITERNTVSTVTVAKGDNYEIPERNIDIVTEELNQARQDYIDLDFLIHTANSKPSVEWDDKKIPIVTAIELAKQLQGETKIIKTLGSKKKQAIENERYSLSSLSGTANVTYTLYDPEEYRKNGLSLERKARLLSQKIEQANGKITLEFEAAERYI